MKTNFIRDRTKIEKILNLILSDYENQKTRIKISRINSGFINFYYQLNDNNQIYFMVFNPTEFYDENHYKIKEKE